MPLKLDVEKVLHGKSERVKCVDVHSSEPWILSALYSGNIFIWNYDTESIVRTFEISEVPVRTAKFIERKNWLVCGTDDMHIRIYNYNTCEKVKEFEAHTDYIRSIAVHPSLPFILSASDDMSIKLWDWDNHWENSIIFEGHTHYVMQIAINPKDNNSFASASLDRSVKVWGLNSSVPHFQLEGHERGVNAISYYGGGERPFLVSGADDNLVKVWDYQTKTCIATLEGHTANISAVAFHPSLPIIISGSEDGAIKIWHSSTYRLETTLHYGMERVWCVACMATSNRVAIGFDEGTIMIALGQEEPMASMDSSGKVVWARNHDIQLLKLLRGGPAQFASVADGEVLPQLSVDDLGSTEFYPSYVRHNKNGQLLAVCGDGEYTIYTSLRLKHKSFGEAHEFAWSSTESDVYATRHASKLKIYRAFKEDRTIRVTYPIARIFGGHLLAVKSASEDDESVFFYSWQSGVCIRRIECAPTQVYWSSEGALVALVCAEHYYVLRYRQEIVDKYMAHGVDVAEHGIETAFELEHDVNDAVVSGGFSNDVFLYTTDSRRLQYYVGGQVITLAHLDRVLYVLGYLHRANRVFCVDKQYQIVSFALQRYVLAYQCAIVADDEATANSLIDKGKIDAAHYNKLAHFLEAQSRPEMALRLSTDAEHQFELALSLRKLALAKQILMRAPSPQKWKQLADLALRQADVATAEEAALQAKDLSLLLLLYTACNYQRGLRKVYDMARQSGKYNVAFNAAFYLGDVGECWQLLMMDEDNTKQNQQVPQAAMFARTYCPQRVPDTVRVWKEKLKRISPAAANALGSPQTHPDAFPDADAGDDVDGADAVDEEPEEEEEEVQVEDVAPDRESEPPVVQAEVEEEEEKEEEKEKNLDISDDVSLPSGVEDEVDNGEDQANAVNGNDEDDDDDDFNIDDLEDI